MFVKIIYGEIKQILTNKLLLIIVFSISFVTMFAEYLAFEANAIGMTSAVFSMLILSSVFLSFRYLIEYLMKLHVNQIAIVASLGMKQNRLLIGFGILVFIASMIAFFVGSLLGGITFVVLARTVLAEWLNGIIDYFLLIWFRAFIFFTSCMLISLVINLFCLRHKTLRELFEQKVKDKKKPINLKWNIAMFLLNLTFLIISIISLNAEGNLFLIALNSGTVFLISTIVLGYFVLYGSFEKLKSFCYGKTMSHLLIYSIFTKNIRKNILISVVLSFCLILSFGAYMTGSILLLEGISLFQDDYLQVYFSVIQICISILILIIYFIVLAMDIASELNLLKNDVEIIYQLGSSKEEINQTLMLIIILKFLIPAIAFWSFVIVFFLIMNNLALFNTFGISIFSLIITFSLLYYSFLIIYALILYKRHRHET